MNSRHRHLNTALALLLGLTAVGCSPSSRDEAPDRTHEDVDETTDVDETDTVGPSDLDEADDDIGDSDEGDTDPPACTTVDAAVATHVAAMATQGWAALNAAASMSMVGCEDAVTSRDCFSTEPRANTTLYGADWEADLPDAVLRILRVNAYASSYWTRSSPDGRFVAHGGDSGAGGSATIIDLNDGGTIGVAANYDPGFFPDGSGFVFHGSDTRVCTGSVLASSPTTLMLNEPGCAELNSVGLNPHLGCSLNGGAYWIANGQFASDNGGHTATLSDPAADYPSDASLELVPLTYDGTRFIAGSAVSQALAYQGDAVLSPSARLLVTRVGDGSGLQQGYRLYQLQLTPAGNSYEVALSELADYCVNGGVPAFSYDERWLVFHHYVSDSDAVDLGFGGATDPDFQAYRTQGAANVYLLDLTTGEVTRLTRMAAGQYALYPHFRSDGWIYFVVRVLGESTEYIVASDAVLLDAP